MNGKERILKLKKAGASGAEIARIMNVSPQYVSQILNQDSKKVVRPVRNGKFA